MAVSGAAVSVSALAVWEVLARAGRAGHSHPPVEMLGEKSGTSG